MRKRTSLKHFEPIPPLCIAMTRGFDPKNALESRKFLQKIVVRPLNLGIVEIVYKNETLLVQKRHGNPEGLHLPIIGVLAVAVKRVESVIFKALNVVRKLHII